MSCAHRRRFGPASVCLLLLASFALAACGGGDTGAPPSGAPTSGAPAQADGNYPVTVENCGRTLTFDKAPSRAVITYHPYVETFVGLGLGDRAVGRSVYKGQPVDFPVSPSQASAIERIPVVSENSGPPPKEQMLALRPHFLFAYGDYDYEGQGRATREQLQDAGVTSYQVVCPDEHEEIADTYRTILDLGKIFNVRERAQQRVEEMQRQIADVQAKVRDEPPVRVIAYNGATRGPLEVSGQGTLTETLEAAGARNVWDDEPTTYFDASAVAVDRPVTLVDSSVLLDILTGDSAWIEWSESALVQARARAGW